MTKSKFYGDSNIVFIGKIKDETESVSTKEFIRLDLKMYSLLVGDNSEHKKAKNVNRKFDVTISHNKYKTFLFN